jgi:hypothetical protein
MSDQPLKTEPPAPPKSHRLEYAPPPTFRDKIARYLPSPEQFVNFLKTLIWVAPLTLLIWIYAEREQNVTQEGIIVPIEVTTSNPNRIVTLRGPADKNIVLELSGPRAKIDHIRDLLKPDPTKGAQIAIDIDPQISAGENKPATIQLINNNPIFKANGITVKSAQPPYLVVDIDTYEEREVPVKPSPDVAGLLTDQTHFTPDTIKVRAPKSLIETESKHSLFVYADLSNRDEIKTRTGLFKIDSVPVYWPGQRENVHLTPTSITATLDIKLRDITLTIASIPISKETSIDFNGKVECDDRIYNVVVSGPPEQIELLKKDAFKPKAVLEIFSLDAKDILIHRKLKFDLPAGVSLTPDTAAKTVWNFTITDRDK